MMDDVSIREITEWFKAQVQKPPEPIIVHESWGASAEEISVNIVTYTDKYPCASDKMKGMLQIRAYALLASPMPDGPPPYWIGEETGREMLDFFTDRVPADVLKG